MVPGEGLKEVATGSVICPKNKDVMHTVSMGTDIMRVKITTVVPEYRDIRPPFNPPGADDDTPLHLCYNWVMPWPKSQIRLGGGTEGPKLPTGGTSVRRPMPIRPPTKRAPQKPAVAAATTTHKKLKVPPVGVTREEPVLVANTTRHQELLGQKPLPRRPSKTKAVAPQPPASQPLPVTKDADMAPPLDHDDGGYQDNDDYDQDEDDVGAYLNTGACSNDAYMPPVDDGEAFRDHHDDQPRRPNPAPLQRQLVFQGLSQEQDTPPVAGDAAVKKPGTIFSPTTLNRTVNEVGVAPPEPADKKKKARKRKPKTAPGASMSQPAPQIRHDSVIPPRPDGLTRVHEAGKPILSDDLLCLASGPMISLNSTILYLEETLLKQKDPTYPAFVVNVPEDEDFVHEEPAGLFFIAYEDVFKLFHLRRLDYNLVRLYAINLQLKIKRELPPEVAVADPYYMRDSQLVEGSVTRTRAVEYFESFILRYKEKNSILLPIFPE